MPFTALNSKGHGPESARASGREALSKPSQEEQSQAAPDPNKRGLNPGERRQGPSRQASLQPNAPTPQGKEPLGDALLQQSRPSWLQEGSREPKQPRKKQEPQIPKPPFTNRREQQRKPGKKGPNLGTAAVVEALEETTVPAFWSLCVTAFLLNPSLLSFRVISLSVPWVRAARSRWQQRGGPQRAN